MNTSEHWNIYVEYTNTVSENARKLAFGSAAVCWFFKSQNITFPPAVYGALLFIILYFLFDLLQYFSAAFIRRIWIRKMEIELYKKTGSIEGNMDQPDWIDKPVYIFYILKISSLLITFCFLISEFLYRI